MLADWYPADSVEVEIQAPGKLLAAAVLVPSKKKVAYVPVRESETPEIERKAIEFCSMCFYRAASISARSLCTAATRNQAKI